MSAPKFAVGAALFYEGRVPVRVLRLFEGRLSGVPLYWVASPAGRFVVAEPWLSARAAR